MHEPKASALRNRVLSRQPSGEASALMKPHRHCVVSLYVLVLSCDLQPIRFEVSF